MSAIKTPVTIYKDEAFDNSYVIVTADGNYIVDGVTEKEAREIAAAINACAGLTVEAMEQGVVERAIEYVRNNIPGYAGPTRGAEIRQARERAALLALIPAAPNSEAGHD